MNRIVFLVVLLQLISVGLYSQSKTIILKGKVVDKTSQLAIPLSEVVLTNDSNTVLLYSVVYSDDASFVFQNVQLHGASINLEVRSLGYDKMTMTAPLDYIDGEINLGEIELVPLERTLETVTVVGSARKEDVNKNTYFINDSNLKNASASIDVLRTIPELIVNDLTRDVSIKGKENTLVLINGVNTGESVDIRSISYTDIERVEVVNFPPSAFDIKYDGVINIILKTKVVTRFSIDVEDSVKGNLKSNTGYVALRLGLNKVHMRFMYENYYRGMPTEMKQNRIDNVTKSIYTTYGNMKRREWSHDFRFNLDYYLSDKDFFNISTNTSLSDNNRRLFNDQTTENNGVINKLPDFETQFKSKYTIGNYTLYYKHKFEKPETELTFNGNFNFQNTTENVNTDYSSGSAIQTHETGDKISTNLKIDYKSQFNPSFKYNIGTQGYYQDFDSKVDNKQMVNNFRNYNFNAYTDAFWYFEKNMLTIGLKAENNTYDFKESNNKKVNHFILLPRVNFLNKLNDANTLNMYYYRSSYYPSAWLLSPYTIQVDEKTSSIGNMKLKPETYDYLGIAHTYRKYNFFIRTTVSYAHGKKIVSRTRTFDNQLNVVIRPDNVGTTDFLNLHSSTSFTLFRFIQFDPEVSVWYRKYNINGDHRDRFGFNFSATLYAMLPKNFSTGAMGSYDSRTINTLGHRNASYDLDYIFVSKNFPKIGLTLFAGYQDPFKSATRSYTFDGNFTEYNYSKTKTRGFAFRLVFNFTSGSKVSIESIPDAFDIDKK